MRVKLVALGMALGLVALATGCKKKLDKGKTCDQLGKRYSAVDPAKFQTACMESPNWVVTCMAQKPTKDDCLKQMAADVDGAYRKLNEVLAGAPQVPPKGSDFVGGSAPGGGGSGSAVEPATGGGGAQPSASPGGGEPSVAPSTEPAAVSASDLDHQMFQAAASTGDVAVMTAISQKVGIADKNGVPNDKMEPFMSAHTDWAMKNTEWIIENATDPVKAKAWLDANNK